MWEPLLFEGHFGKRGGLRIYADAIFWHARVSGGAVNEDQEMGMQIMARIMALILAVAAGLGAAETVKVDTKHGTAREMQVKAELEQIVAKYDLSKYTFSRKVVIEEGAIAHSFPLITLNVRFLNSDDELLSSFIHEELHWHLQAHRDRTNDAIKKLQQMYPWAPVGGTEGAETKYSTYGHLVDCYLEIQADRALMGAERTAAVIRNKGHYTWIYDTVLKDEAKIAAIVKWEGLEID